MKIIRGFTIGGLQQKIFNLMLIFILALIGVYAAVSIFQQRNLSGIVQEASAEQQASITTISRETMKGVLDSTAARSTALQAYIADDLFADVKTDVMTLQSFAEELFAHADSFPAHPFSGPDAANDGIASVQVQHEEGVDPAESEALGLAANMSEVMLAMFENSGKLSSCFVATPDGCILYVDDRAGSYFSETGEVYTFDVRQRPWYLQAVEAGELIFTGVELDAFTDIPGLVCAAPVYRDGELAAVVGADIFLTDVSDYVVNTASEGSFICLINQNGQVLFSPAQDGVFKAEVSDRAEDLRANANEALAGFITRSLRERTELTLVEIDGKEYYLTGAPLETLGWTVVSVVEKEITNRPTEAMLAQYDSINERAMGIFEKGAKHSEQTFIVTTVIIIVLALGSALLLAARVVKPLERITKRVQSLGGNDLEFKMEKAYRTGDEIEVLAESFAMLSGKTLQYIDQVARSWRWPPGSRRTCCRTSTRPSRSGTNSISTPPWTRRRRSAAISTTSSLSTTTTCAWSWRTCPARACPRRCS